MAKLTFKKTNPDTIVVPAVDKIAFGFDESGNAYSKDSERLVKYLSASGNLALITLTELLALTGVPNGKQYLVTDYPTGQMSLFIRENANWRYVQLTTYVASVTEISGFSPPQLAPEPNQACTIYGNALPTEGEISLILNDNPFTAFTVTNRTDTSIELSIDLTGFDDGVIFLNLLIDEVQINGAVSFNVAVAGTPTVTGLSVTEIDVTQPAVMLDIFGANLDQIENMQLFIEGVTPVLYTIIEQGAQQISGVLNPTNITRAPHMLSINDGSELIAGSPIQIYGGPDIDSFESENPIIQGLVQGCQLNGHVLGNLGVIVKHEGTTLPKVITFQDNNSIGLDINFASVPLGEQQIDFYDDTELLYTTSVTVIS